MTVCGNVGEGESSDAARDFRRCLRIVADAREALRHTLHGDRARNWAFEMVVLSGAVASRSAAAGVEGCAGRGSANR